MWTLYLRLDSLAVINSCYINLVIKNMLCDIKQLLSQKVTMLILDYFFIKEAKRSTVVLNTNPCTNEEVEATCLKD